nr:hypothetical protein [Tanacetum cinerariifolium]
DFNAALNLEDSSVGSSSMDISMREFKKCVEEIELMDVPRSSLQFTWNQAPEALWAVLRIPLATKHPSKTFKIVNVTNTLPRFKEVGNLHENVRKLRFELDRVQSDLDLDPFNNDLRDEEAVYVCAFTDALITEERFLKQKSKVEWLRVGDSNSAYFHKSVKGRVNHNCVDVVTDLAGDMVTDDGVPVAFVSYYEAFLGQQGSCFPYELFLNRLDSNQALDMIKNVTAKEVKDAIFSMGNDKSPELNHTIIDLIPKALFQIGLVNLCFVDDLFLFAHGDPNSARVIMEALDEFQNASGLTPSLPKSMAYFCNVLNHVTLSILRILLFEEGRLPVKYLEVPLNSTRLIYRDCKELTDQIRSRIKDWKNKSVSAAGRLQLVRSVIGSMHVYWASVFVLPTRILLELEQLMRGFLWFQGDMWKGKAKVSWEVSLWVKRIHEYKLRGRHFFEVPYSGNMTWGWRKFLQLRPLIHDHVRYHLGNGATCSLWFDFVGPRVVHWLILYLAVTFRLRLRLPTSLWFNLSSKVQVAVANGAWIWHSQWYSKYPILNSLAAPNLSDVDDRLEWRDQVGVVKPFLVAAVGNCVRPRSDVVNWCDVVWFSNCIPRHAFHLWLVAKRRLKTQCERNFRLFKSQKRTPLQVIDCIKSSVRLKLLSCTFKKSKDALVFQRL